MHYRGFEHLSIKISDSVDENNDLLYWELFSFLSLFELKYRSFFLYLIDNRRISIILKLIEKLLKS